MSAPETAAPKPVTICPECGAKIPKAGMSLCPYCASPLQKTAGQEGEDRNPIVERLLKMEEKEEFKAALEEAPPWTPEYAAGKERQGRGTLMLAAGVVLVALKFVVLSGGWSIVALVVGIALLLFGAAQLILGSGTCARLDKQPVLRRSAYLVRRRSDTSLELGNRVTYYYLIQFGDGSEGEFCYPGRGTAEEPYTNGMMGVAFTRGQELLYVTRVRA